MAGQGRAMDRMAMKHCHELRARRKHIGMETPFGGRSPATLLQRLALPVDRHQITRLHPFVGKRAGSDQQTFRETNRKIAGGALVETRAIHAPSHSHQLLPQSLLSHRRRAP